MIAKYLCCNGLKYVVSFLLALPKTKSQLGRLYTNVSMFVKRSCIFIYFIKELKQVIIIPLVGRLKLPTTAQPLHQNNTVDIPYNQCLFTARIILIQWCLIHGNTPIWWVFFELEMNIIDLFGIRIVSLNYAFFH